MRIERIGKPIIKELPYFVFSLALLGVGEVIWKLWNIYHGIPMSGQITPQSLWGSLLIWITAGYFATLLIDKTKAWVKVLLYAILLVMWAIQNFLRMEYGSPISPTYLSLLFETNPDEAQGFFQMIVHLPNFVYTVKKLLLGIILILISELVYGKLFKIIPIPNWCYAAIAILLIPIIAAGLYSSRRYIQLLAVDSVDNDIQLQLPRDPFSCTYNAFIALNRSAENTRRFIQISTTDLEANLQSEADDSLNIVLIIGESYNKYHAQVYGYTKETTPFMSQEFQAGRLFPFYDVCAPSNMTSVVIKNALSTNCMGYGEKWYDYPYVMTLFHKAGYDIYFWDNQKQDLPQGSVEFSLHSILYNPSISAQSYTRTNEKAYHYDLDLVNSFVETVDTIPSSHNLFVFHLMGQHFSARERYPDIPENRIFSASDYSNRYEFYDETIKGRIAEYDNATVYNDNVIKEIVDRFEDRNTIVIYFSDHAEEVYDYRNHISRDQGGITPEKLKYQYEIPFVIWFSDQYMSRHPEIVDKTISAQYKPFNTDNLPHLLLSLGEIDSKYYIDRLNVIEPAYECPPRVLFESSETYDEIISPKE